MEGESFKSSDLYAPIFKAPEAKFGLLAATAPEHSCPFLKTDTLHPFLKGEMEEDEKVYIRSPDWWLDSVPDGHVFLLFNL